MKLWLRACAAMLEHAGEENYSLSASAWLNLAERCRIVIKELEQS